MSTGRRKVKPLPLLPLDEASVLTVFIQSLRTRDALQERIKRIEAEHYPVYDISIHLALDFPVYKWGCLLGVCSRFKLKIHYMNFYGAQTPEACVDSVEKFMREGVHRWYDQCEELKIQ